MTKRLALAAAGLVLLATLSCGEGIEGRENEVRAALARTKRLTRSFVYTERTSAAEIAVRGIVEDDYRYKAQASRDGTPTHEEIAVDDALAARLLDLTATDVLTGAAAPGATTPSVAASVAGSTRPRGRELEALLARRWVLDPFGAPELVVTRAGAERTIGDDPVLDGLTVLGYVEGALSEALLVVRFNKESAEYQEDEDVFPAPEASTGVTRYDTVAPDLPRPNRSGAGAAQGSPQTNHFRRMAIYVRDGRVVEVREAVAPVRRQLEHLAEFYDIEPASDDLAVAGREAIAELNELRTGAGEQQIRMRTMSLELFDLGAPQRVTLPTDAIEGKLDILTNRGRTNQ